MVISRLLLNFIPDHATKHWHFIVSNCRKTFHLFLENGELPALPNWILQNTFKHFWKWIVHLHWIPCQGGSLCELSSTLVENIPMLTSEEVIRHFCTRPLCVTRCIPMGHSTGLRLSAHRGTMWFALSCSGPHHKVVHRGTLPDRFGTGTVRFRCIQAPLWCVTVMAHWKRGFEHTLRYYVISKIQICITVFLYIREQVFTSLAFLLRIKPIRVCSYEYKTQNLE